MKLDQQEHALLLTTSVINGITLMYICFPLHLSKRVMTPSNGAVNLNPTHLRRGILHLKF
jgi:hypothetical protein